MGVAGSAGLGFANYRGPLLISALGRQLILQGVWERADRICRFKARLRGFGFRCRALGSEHDEFSGRSRDNLQRSSSSRGKVQELKSLSCCPAGPCLGVGRGKGWWCHDFLL